MTNPSIKNPNLKVSNEGNFYTSSEVLLRIPEVKEQISEFAKIKVKDTGSKASSSKKS